MKTLNITAAAVLVIAVHEVALPVLFCWFAFAAPARALWARYLKPLLPGRVGTGTAVD